MFVAYTFGLGVLLVLAGCGEQEQIRRVRIPQPVKIERPAPPAVDRMLVAVAPRDDFVWFFKFAGPVSAVERYAPAFERLIQSVKFDNGKPTWTMPESDWQQQGPGDMRYATIRIPGGDNSADKALEIAISQLPAAGYDPERNINRWRQQLKLDPLPSGTWRSAARFFEMGGTPAHSIDITGQLSTDSRPFAPFMSRGPASPLPAEDRAADVRPSAPFDSSVPDGWLPGPTGALRSAAYLVNDQDQQVKITAIKIEAPVQALETVNLWRQEVGLDSVDAAAMATCVEEFTVDGLPASYIKLSPPNDNREAKALLAVIVPRGETTWYFKMVGNAGLVNREQTRFESYMHSIRFQP